MESDRGPGQGMEPVLAGHGSGVESMFVENDKGVESMFGRRGYLRPGTVLP